MKVSILSIICLSSLIVFSCNKKKDDDSSDYGSTTESSEKEEDDDKSDDEKDGALEAGQVGLGESLASLEISGALALDVPPTVAGSGDGVSSSEAGTVNISAGLVGRDLSESSCELNTKVADFMGLFWDASFFMCELESESEQIEVGKKYHINFVPEVKTSIWIDDSEKGKYLVNLCVDDTLRYKITLLKKDKEKVRMLFKDVAVDQHDNKVIFDASFDTGYANNGVTTILANVKSIVDMGGGDTLSLYEHHELDLVKDGISVVKTVVRESHDVDTSSNSDRQFVAKSFDTIGAVAKSFTDSSSSTTSQRGWFDDKMQYLSQGDSALFTDSTGALYVSDSDLLADLPDSFDVAGFSASKDWDCSGTTGIKHTNKTGANACTTAFTRPDYPGYTCDDAPSKDSGVVDATIDRSNFDSEYKKTVLESNLPEAS